MPKKTQFAFLIGVLAFALQVRAADPQAKKWLEEPVFRIAKNIDQRAIDDKPAHPLDAALKIAYDGLKRVRTEIDDCTVLMIKRERIDGKLGESQYMFTKVRERKVDQNGKVIVPLSVYTKFLKPRNLRGQEAIWVEGKNSENKLVAHASPTKFIQKRFTVWLDPDGKRATAGSKYRIYNAGLENFVLQMIEIAERDRNYGECKVNFYKNAAINDRVCTLIEVIHPHRRNHFTFHIARIYIDDKLGVPIRYASWGWPANSGGKPILQEEVTYLNIKVNVGLKDKDFDHNNPDYAFP